MSSRIVLAMVVGMCLGGAGKAASQAAPAVYDPIAPSSKVRVTLVPSTGSEVIQGTWVGRTSHEFMILTDGRADQARQFTRDEVAQLEVGTRGAEWAVAGLILGGLAGVAVAASTDLTVSEWPDSGMDVVGAFFLASLPVAIGAITGLLVGHQFDRTKWAVVEW